MRIAIAWSAVALAVLQVSCGGGSGTQSASLPPEKKAIESAAALPSTVAAGDPAQAGQLVSGFHAIENNSWRWTARQFAVSLGTPAGAARSGATLELKLTVPPPTIEKLQSLTLSASIAGKDLGPETYSRPGPYVYRRDVPAGQLGSSPVKVEFQLDKAMQPGGADVRELGVVVSSIALLAK